MKHFAPREFVLLCSPLVIVAIVGFLFSRRKPPPPDAGKLRLEFHIQKPTVLEAFKGVDAALVAELKGPNTTPGPNVDQLRVWASDPYLEVQTPNGPQRSWWRNSGKNWRDVWKGNLNSTRITINSRAIPPGKLRFGMNAVISPMSSGPKGKAPRLTAQWPVDRARIKPFDFANMARVPLVRLTAVKILQVNPKGNIRGEAIFNFTGTAMNADTTFDYNFTEREGGMSYGFGSSDLTPQTPTSRVREWTVYKGGGLIPGQKRMVHIVGRASANERWPLAFEFEPFDFNTAKVGQTLKFKFWPAPLPKP